MKREKSKSNLSFEDYRTGLAERLGYEIDTGITTYHDFGNIAINNTGELLKEVGLDKKLPVYHYLRADINNAGALWISGPVGIKVSITNSILPDPFVNPCIVLDGDEIPLEYLKKSRELGFYNLIETLFYQESIEYLKPYRIQGSPEFCVFYNQAVEFSFNGMIPIHCLVTPIKKAKKIRKYLINCMKSEVMKDAFFVS